MGETFANSKSREQLDTFYYHLREKYKLAPQEGLIAQSRGGRNHYNLAADHPEWVNCIAGIYTDCDIRCYPGLACAAPS